MDVLWWFYMIVLGTAFAQIAMALAVQWKIRAATGDPLYLPTTLWMFFLLVLTIEVWISVGFYVNTVVSMSVLSLMAFLWVPMGILILSVFLSDSTWRGASPTSDEERFSRLRKSFFTVLLLIPLINLAHETILGNASVDQDLLFPLLIAAGAIVGYFLRSTRADTLLAGAMLIVIGTYLFTSYGTVSVI